jgi:hypothetical protein
LDNIEVLRELPLGVHIAAICFVVCVTVLFVMLVASPWRNCFFFRWSPEMRFLALLFLPALIILWPIVLYVWLVKSGGIDPDDLDFSDD